LGIPRCTLGLFLGCPLGRGSAFGALNCARLRFGLTVDERGLVPSCPDVRNRGLVVGFSPGGRFRAASGRHARRRSESLGGGGSCRARLRGCPHEMRHVERGAFGDLFGLTALSSEALLHLDAPAPAPPEHRRGKDKEENCCRGPE
jgi:hypothetical protein